MWDCVICSGVVSRYNHFQFFYIKGNEDMHHLVTILHGLYVCVSLFFFFLFLCLLASKDSELITLSPSMQTAKLAAHNSSLVLLPKPRNSYSLTPLTKDDLSFPFTFLKVISTKLIRTPSKVAMKSS